MQRRISMLAGAALAAVVSMLPLAAQTPAAPTGGPAPAQATSPVPPLIREGVTEKISAHVHVIPDNGVSLVPNVGIVVGSKATLVIDTGLGTRNGATVMREVAKVSTNADVYLVTTHVHPEHDLGTGGFPATVKMIRSKDQVDEIAASGLEMAKRFSGFSPLHAELLQGAEFRKADVVFEKEHTLDLGGVTVKFLAMGFNHTRGDTATFVEPDKVLFSGDVAMAWLPSVGGGANLNQWITSQDRFLALQPSRVVPSHGPMGDTAIMTKTKAFVATIQKRAAELKAAGRTIDETVTALQAELAPAFGASPRMAGPIRAAYNQAPAVAATPAQARHVVFMCPHGAAKSVLASAYFERLAKARGLNVRVDARGTEPDPAVSPKVAEHLTKNGYRIPVATPQRVSPADLASADIVISLGCDVRGLDVRAGTLRQWDDVPGPGEDFAGADAAIQRRVAALVDELARQVR
jgi:glyoxylase-like metal-dependent hydrolase (beta-lactamase superfamily II)/protein-tyrosine-phosphatase